MDKDQRQIVGSDRIGENAAYSSVNMHLCIWGALAKTVNYKVRRH